MVRRRLVGWWMAFAFCLIAGCGSEDPGASPAVAAAPAVLASLQVTEAIAARPVGINQQYLAIGTFSDGHAEAMTSRVTWHTSDASKASVDAAGMATTIAVGTTTITATAGTIGSNRATLTVTAAELVSLQTTPAVASRPAGTTQAYAAIGTYSDATHVDVTSTVAWTSGDRTVATVGSTGLANALASGATAISASLGVIRSSPATLTVTAATLVSVQITPPVASRAVGVDQAYQASGLYTDGTVQDVTTSVDWLSSDTSKARVAPSGLATTLAPGDVAVTARFRGLSSNTASLGVTPATVVSVQVGPAAASIANGTTQQYAAIATFTDGRAVDVTTSAGWSSSDASRATIDLGGLATAVALGNAGVTATLNGVQSNVAALSVTRAVLANIQITPATVARASGTTQQYTATGFFTDRSSQDLTATVAWTSSDVAKATITASGLATAVGIGPSTITAALGAVRSNASTFTSTTATLVALQVTPPAAGIALGTTQPFVATGRYTDGSTQDLTSRASWVSSSPADATVDPAGLATGVAVGSVGITAAIDGVQSNVGALTVTAARLVSLQVTPAVASIAAGLTQPYVAIGTYTDHTTQDLSTSVSWASSDPTRASLDVQGLATSSAPGTTTVTAMLSGLTSNAATLTITNATLTTIQVTPAAASIAAGTTQQFVATGTYTDQSTQDITPNVVWTSSDTSKATVGAHGLATAVAVGSAQIQASTGGTTSNAAALTVTAAQIVSIQVTPATTTLAAGTTQQFMAIATYTDGSTQNVSTIASWASANATVATVNATGLATASSAGATAITATVGSTSSNGATLTVTPVPLVSIAITPASASKIIGTKQQYTATGTYANGSTQDITSIASWTSSSSAVATIGGTGLATAVAAGSANIQATRSSIGSNLAVLTVDPNAAVAGPPTQLRSYHSGVLLANGTALMVGSLINDVANFTSETYDPRTGLWTAAGNMSVGHAAQPVVLLADGRVLAPGGFHTPASIETATAEIYDPTTRTWSVTGTMVKARYYAAVVLLSNGKVLVIGGLTASIPQTAAELYDPASGTWSATAPMGTARSGAVAVVLPSGKVLVTGGPNSGPQPSELYDPATEQWTATGTAPFNASGSSGAVLLPNGRVLMTGSASQSAVYDPATGTWTSMGASTAPHGFGSYALLLPSGKVAVVGNSTVVDLYDPATGTFSNNGTVTSRANFGAVLLGDGRILMSGGGTIATRGTAGLY